MSARGVRNRILDTLIENRGHLKADAFDEIIRYAERGPLTRLEVRHIVAPRGFVLRSRRLQDAGIAPAALQAEDGVFDRAEAFAREQGVATDFAIFQRGDTGGGDAAQDARAALAEALEKGDDLGDFSEWTLQTPGADVRFCTEVFGRSYPALVMDKPTFQDPGSRDLVAENRAALTAPSTLADLGAAAREIIDAEADYFDAADITDGSRNRRYGIQNSRRSDFLVGLRNLAVARPGIGLAVNALLIDLRDDIVSGRRFDMDVGTHTNYWPYDNNYADVLEKIWTQLPEDSPTAHVVANRLADIYRRKSVFRGRSGVDEKDAETTLGGCVIWRKKFGPRDGHRVSLAEGSDTYSPTYEVLSLASSGLPAAFSAFAGAQVYRDTDGTVRFDLSSEHPEQTGKPVPEAILRHVEAKKVEHDELSLRQCQAGEEVRRNFSFDWNDNNDISVTRIDIGWWGHCHNEAPANAMGMDPKKGVTLYRADRGVPPHAAKVVYSEEDCWDLVGAFTSDHEGDRIRDPRTGRVSSPGYVVYSSGGRYTPTRVNETSFVGNRNNGGHWFQVTPTAGRRIRIEAEVKEIWGLEDPTVRYNPPMNRFRRDCENDDGTFTPNPDWVESGMSDNDMIAVKAGGRKLKLQTTFITFNDKGRRYEQKLTVKLDPDADEFLKLGEEIEGHHRSGGGRIVEFWYNAKTQQIRTVRFEISSSNGFKREETSRETSDSREVIAVQETTYDSVVEIDEFVVSDMGLPLTFDTSSGQAVWNYPVDFISRDVEGRVTRDEDGEEFTYTTYRLKYDTMGGPSGDTSYIIKRDDRGRTVRALALKPMPDFAYRNEHWACAPMVEDVAGRAAVNLRGLTTGYLTDPSGRDIVPDLWERQALLLYASMTDATADGMAWLFEADDGQVVSFSQESDWRAAVEADQKLRELNA